MAGLFFVRNIDANVLRNLTCASSIATKNNIYLAHLLKPRSSSCNLLHRVAELPKAAVSVL
jgi:hypothetical protein